MSKIFIAFSIFVLVIACVKEKNDAEQNFSIRIPDHFPAVNYDLTLNPISKEGFELGRKLFYDPILSRDSSISCGSCHQQSAGFTQHGHDISHGIDDLLGTRNALPVMNLIWNKSFFWDGGVHNLDFVPINAITSKVEMDESLENAIGKLNRHPQYPSLFKSWINVDKIESKDLLKALSQFMAFCVSANSKYDQSLQVNSVQLTSDEFEGLQLVNTKCSPCHSTALFTDFSFRNNGLVLTGDLGRYKASLVDSDLYRFRVPSLRNLSYTAPYMHDGRFRTIDQVLDHYANKVVMSATLDSNLIRKEGLGIPLTEEEKTKIKLFLKTLDDESFIRNPILSEQ
ncbi:MAG TPA: cytochrome c peroxidase [Saprospiraceae bacterium]|nr:cytochrome c peroxidase [Saprospiraceae bacterium]